MSRPGAVLRLASRHRPPPVGALVAAWPVRAVGHAPQGAVGSAAARPGERVLGQPADPRRARGAGASPWRRRQSGKFSRAPGSTRRRAATAQGGPGSFGHRRRESWPWISSPPTSSTVPTCVSQYSRLTAMTTVSAWVSIESAPASGQPGQASTAHAA